MSADFLSNFMRVALEITGAERAVACDAESAIINFHNIEQTDLLSEKFSGMEIVRQSLESGLPIITNNAVSSITDAPVTNTNYSNLRVIVVIPIAGVGAIYLDQPIRKGIIPKDKVDRLAALAQRAATDSSAAELKSLYQEIG